MYSFRNCLGVTLLAAVVALTAQPAIADTYSLYQLSIANGNIDRAVYDDGTAMVSSSSCPATNGDPCYKTYDHGSLLSLSAIQPTTAWDNGSACSFAVAGYQVSGRCNGNYEAFSLSKFDPLANVLAPGVYAGALDDLGLVYSAGYNGIAALFLNGRGDIAFEDALTEEIYQAYNTTPAPEPGTLLLLTSGLALGVVTQRKIFG